MGYLVVGCSRCGSRRVVPEGQKTAQCPRCPAKIDLSVTNVLFSSPLLEEAQAFIGEDAAKKAGELPSYRREAGRPTGKQDARSRELSRIAESVPRASGRLNQLKLILRKGFEAFEELSEADLERIARDGGLEGSGAQLSDEIVGHGLAGRTAKGALVPLREGR